MMPGSKARPARSGGLAARSPRSSQPPAKKTAAGKPTAQSASELIDAKIKALTDWRGEMLARLRELIKEADPEAVEEWKWSTPVWSHDGLICTGETYKKVVKMTFAKGASLSDPAGLFNSSLEGNVRRAIDFYEGDEVNRAALKALIRAAVRCTSLRAATSPQVAFAVAQLVLIRIQLHSTKRRRG